MYKPRYSKQIIEAAISKSKTITDVLRVMGLGAHGRNYDSVRRWMTHYQISFSSDKNELYKNRIDNLKLRNTIPLENILVKNSTYKGSNFKERLYKCGLKKRECEKCGGGEIWKGLKIALILDHKDGDHTNNELINLRILCPNCNATLPTHCGKNKKKRYFCEICGGEKKCKTSKNCNKCSMKPKRRAERPDIETLKNEIDKLGYSGTGRKYGVSDNAIRKWLK